MLLGPTQHGNEPIPERPTAVRGEGQGARERAHPEKGPWKASGIQQHPQALAGPYSGGVFWGD